MGTHGKMQQCKPTITAKIIKNEQIHRDNKNKYQTRRYKWQSKLILNTKVCGRNSHTINKNGLAIIHWLYNTDKQRNRKNNQNG